ncbi:hypothetical protein AGMMS49928_20360 [Spirochaetia bacterium]|nr:hypothetical protein AGMMS49928_20360 [Spirochaetia bacterium]
MVYRSGTTVTSDGYNVVDVAFGTGTAQSGWTAGTGDKTISVMPVSPVSFKLLSGSGAANVLPTPLPEGYPTTDFYGAAITSGKAAGAVQAATSVDGYGLYLSVNNSAWGSVSMSGQTPNAEGLVSGSVTITATPTEGINSSFEYWLVNGVKSNVTSNPLPLNVTAHTTVRAVFGLAIIVTNLSDAEGSEDTVGTLRYALTNVAEDGDTIRFSAGLVTAGTSVIELDSPLPVTKSITIEGNGVTITNASDKNYNLLIVNSNKTVNINRVHFKNGGAEAEGAAINVSSSATLNLESCIFSGNQSNYEGGAILNNGALTVKGCTFYGNSALGLGGAIYNGSGTATLTLTGNLFYGNTAGDYPVVRRGSGTVTSDGYNVVDVAFGTGTTQSGWTAGTGDKTFADLSISDIPVNTSTFAPLGAALNIVPSGLAGFPTLDFYGNTRTFPCAPGAVVQ